MSRLQKRAINLYLQLLIDLDKAKKFKYYECEHAIKLKIAKWEKLKFIQEVM